MTIKERLDTLLLEHRGTAPVERVDLLQGTLDLLILKAVSLGGLHGCGVLIGLQVQQGSLYPALYRLERKGLIAAEWGESENKRRAKFYTLTASGRKQLKAETALWNDFSAVIAGGVARRGARAPGEPVGSDDSAQTRGLTPAAKITGMDNTSTLRLGIAGSGFAGKFHHQNLRGLPAKTVGVTSPRAASREAFAKEFGVRAYESVEAMLPDIDVLDICTPPSSHAMYIRMAAAAGKHVIVEKPFHGFFGSPEQFSKEEMLAAVTEELRDIRRVVNESGILLGYAENYIYAPSVQRERQILEATKAQILRMTAEESHSGSHSPVYGIWSEQGGGSLIGKGCHPLGGVLYLKRKEGMARNGAPIRPIAVSCRTHAITKRPAFEDRGYLRTTYKDTEDYAFLHVIFEDGMIADVMTSELVLGGVYDFIEVYANNHRTRCHIQPVRVVDLYSPDKKEFAGMDLMEKISSNEGWIQAYPEFGWSNGQFYEMHDFVHAMREGRQPECDLELAIDTTLAIYAGYVSADRKGAEVAVPRI